MVDYTSLPIGDHAPSVRIFAQKPKAFGNRFRIYADVWRLEVELPSKKLSEETVAVTASG